MDSMGHSAEGPQPIHSSLILRQRSGGICPLYQFQGLCLNKIAWKSLYVADAKHCFIPVELFVLLKFSYKLESDSSELYFFVPQRDIKTHHSYSFVSVNECHLYCGFVSLCSYLGHLLIVIV